MRVIKILVLAGVLGAGILVGANTLGQSKAQEAACPPGSYSIGDGYCKKEPTGCPFGDSIPMDQCTPPPNIECNADWTDCHPKPIQPAPAPAAATTEPQCQ